MTAKVALVTARQALPLDEDMPPLIAALTARGADVETPFWDDGSVDWSCFDIAVLRSTWDYVERIDEFLAWAKRARAQTRLLNPPEVVRWNTDKHYLVHLDRHGVPVVPTRFVEPGVDTDAEFAVFLSGGEGSLSVGQVAGFSDFVVKPSIGAGSRDAARYRRADADAARTHLRRLVTTERRSAMLQPYLDRVDDHGETALLYFAGTYSHAARKGPLLRAGQGLVEGLFAPEEITPRTADAPERRLAADVVAALPFAAPLYVRVDLIRDGEGRPVVLEVEMTEPSVFLAHAPGAADTFARAILGRVSAGQNQPETKSR
jgi:glutathione synthase/RimK-type ligase-like ATP-grasp enzyme